MRWYTLVGVTYIWILNSLILHIFPFDLLNLFAYSLWPINNELIKFFQVQVQCFCEIC